MGLISFLAFVPLLSRETHQNESMDELVQWLSDFKKHFSKFGLVCPTIEDIKTELKNYLESIEDSNKAEKIKKHVTLLFEKIEEIEEIIENFRK